ncbi:MAG: hypothetical protein JXA58_06805 [Dehalococcoidia bacterium]|nr:hypothetical protein [Dehalococcoidia bacterium]
MEGEEAERVFIRHHDRLRIALNLGHEHFCLYTHLEDRLTSFKPELDRVPAFYNLSLRAHCVEATLSVSRLLDLHRDSASVFAFLKYCESNVRIFEGEWTTGRIAGGEPVGNTDDTPRVITAGHIRAWIDEDCARLSRLPLSGIKASRDKALAHMDRHILTGSVYGLRFPNRDEMKTCFAAIDDVLNRWLWAFDGTGFSLQNSVKKEVDKMLADLRVAGSQ